MASLPPSMGFGSPVNPDGSFRRGDDTIDWAVGTGPGYNWGGEDRRTGQAPVSPAPPEPDSVAPRGTPAWRQAQADRESWIQANRAAGRTLADLGLEPTRGGGLSNYMRYSNTPRGTSGGAVPPSTGLSPESPESARLRLGRGPNGLRTAPEVSAPIRGGLAAPSLFSPGTMNFSAGPSISPDSMITGGNMYGGNRMGGMMPRNSTGLFPITGSPILGGGFMNQLKTRLGQAKRPTPYGPTARAF